MIQRTALFVFVLAFVIGTRGAEAQDAELSDFFGHWQGVGISEQLTDEGEFAYVSRDLDIEIGPIEDAFKITWTAEVRNDEGQLTRKAGGIDFVTVRPGVFEAVGEVADGLSHAHTWARLSGNGLIVYVLEIDEAGVYELSQYVRSLVSKDQLQLGYTRLRDGRPVRNVTAMLSRVAE